MFEINGTKVTLPQVRFAFQRLSGEQESESTNRAHGYDVSSLCAIGTNTLSITSLSCCCSYSFGLRMAEHYTNNALTSKIKERTLSKDASEEIVRSTFKNGDDIQTLSLKVSLRCPLGQMRIKIPIRGKNCKHIQCFDANSYLSINRNNPRFKCPVCNQRTNVNDLVLDSYMEAVLATSPESLDEVEIFSDCSWKAPEVRVTTTLGKRKEITSVEDYSISSPLKKLEVSALLKPKVEIVDLT